MSPWTWWKLHKALRVPTEPVVIARFFHPHEADLVAAMLQSSGIPAVVRRGHSVYVQQTEGGAVLVPPQYADEARRLTEENQGSL